MKKFFARAVAVTPETLEEIPYAIQSFYYYIVFSVIGFVIWATIGTLDVVSMATGEVVPATQLQKVQHLEGGIVKEILVKEGEKVTHDQPLMILESTSSGADVRELRLHMASLEMNQIRFESEAADKDEIALPEVLIKLYPDLAKGTIDRFLTRRKSRASDLLVQDNEVAQRRQDIVLIEARISNNEKSLSLLQEQIKISSSLLKDNLSSRYEHIGLLRLESDLKSRIEEDKSMLMRSKAALLQSEDRKIQIQNSYNKEAREGLEETRRQLAESQERIKKFEDNLKRTTLRAPVDGYIKTIYAGTVGGVITSGFIVMDIVPGTDRLLVEVQLQPGEVGFIHEGQKAFVQLSSASAGRFGKLEGVVIHVSPDTIISRTTGMPYYRIRIQTEKDHFLANNKIDRYTLRPGVMVTAGIVTGESSVLQYLVSPFRFAFNFTFTER